MSGSALLAIVAIPCLTSVIMLGMVLRFSTKIVEKHNGDTKCLRDVAILLRAFRAGPGGMLSTMAKIFKRA